MQDQSRFAFIVGAPRCGTTTLASFLQQHPDVCFSAVKEPHFFTQHDFSGRDEATTRQIVEEEYLQRFFGQCPNDEHCGPKARLPIFMRQRRWRRSSSFGPTQGSSSPCAIRFQCYLRCMPDCW